MFFVFENFIRSARHGKAELPKLLNRGHARASSEALVVEHLSVRHEVGAFDVAVTDASNFARHLMPGDEVKGSGDVRVDAFIATSENSVHVTGHNRPDHRQISFGMRDVEAVETGRPSLGVRRFLPRLVEEGVEVTGAIRNLERGLEARPLRSSLFLEIARSVGGALDEVEVSTEDSKLRRMRADSVMELENHALLHIYLVQVRGEKTEINELQRKISTRQRDKEYQAVPVKAQRELNGLDDIVSDVLFRNRRTHTCSVRSSILTRVEGVVGENCLVVREDPKGSLRVIVRQNLSFL